MSPDPPGRDKPPAIPHQESDGHCSQEASVGLAAGSRDDDGLGAPTSADDAGASEAANDALDPAQRPGVGSAAGPLMEEEMYDLAGVSRMAVVLLS